MNVLSKPLTKKRALLIAIRHVHRKIGSKFGNLPNLNFARRDAEALRDLLIDSHGYETGDITLMMDDANHPDYLWPTHDNILREIDRLTSDAPESCHFVLYFSGHGMEEDGLDRASMRADGKHSEIVCADGKPILDHTLHDHLIKPLQSVKGSKLFALFDCCHSETLLHLQRGNGPTNYSRVWKASPGQLFINLVIALVHMCKLFLCATGSDQHFQNITIRSRANIKKRSNVSTLPAPPRRASTKHYGPPTYVTEEVGEICLSACRYGQSAHDDHKRGLTFTKCFIDAMARKPNMTWMELRDTVKALVSEIRKDYEEAYLNVPHEHWTQDPRYCTTPGMNLTRKVSL